MPQMESDATLTAVGFPSADWRAALNALFEARAGREAPFYYLSFFEDQIVFGEKEKGNSAPRAHPRYIQASV